MGNPTRTTRGNVGVSAAATGGSCSRPVVLRHILEKCIFVCFNTCQDTSYALYRPSLVTQEGGVASNSRALFQEKD
jgi:hypothetical protein